MKPQMARDAATGPGDDKPWRRKRRGRLDEIRAASAKLFFQRGYAATSVQDIADSLAMHKATFYHYYRSKEAILADILDFSHQQVAAAIAASSSGGGDPAQELHGFFERYARCYLQNLDFAKVAFDEWRNLTGDSLNLQRARRQGYEAYVRDAVTRAQRSGLMDRTVNVTLAARYAMGGVGAGIGLILNGPALSLIRRRGRRWALQFGSSCSAPRRRWRPRPVAPGKLRPRSLGPIRCLYRAIAVSA